MLFFVLQQLKLIQVPCHFLFQFEKVVFTVSDESQVQKTLVKLSLFNFHL